MKRLILLATKIISKLSFSIIFPFYPQELQNDCGLACVRMILKFYNKPFHIKGARHKLKSNNGGLSLVELEQLAIMHEFDALYGRIPITSLLEENILPCILHWDTNHFVVLYKVVRKLEIQVNHYYIADPSSGLSVYNDAGFSRKWVLNSGTKHEGIAFFMTPK